MASLEDIQRLVDMALASNGEHVRRVLWPEIERALGQCVDLDWQDRIYLAKYIHNYLDAQALQSARPPMLSLKKVIEEVRADRSMKAMRKTPIKWFSPEPGEPQDLPLPPEEYL